MTLWHLLLGICFATPLVAAIDTATQAKSGLGYAVAILMGLVMGCGFAVAMWVAGRLIGARIKEQPLSRQEWYFRGLYFSAIVWIVVVGLIAQRVLLIALRLMV